jgi:hypothetical protein
MIIKQALANKCKAISNTTNMKNSIIYLLLLLYLKACWAYATGTSSQYHLRRISTIVGANYCVHQRCAVGYCPPLEATGEVMLAYLFAQMRCCAAKLNWRDGYIQGFEGTAEEYCSMIGFDVRNCHEDSFSEDGRVEKVCVYDEEGRRDLDDCYKGCKGRHSVGQWRSWSNYPEMWCCGASKSGPPKWWLRHRTKWLRRRPKGNANQFCMEVGYDIRDCD